MTLFNRTTDQVWVSSICVNFYTPVFRRDVLWYGDVRPSVRPSAHFLHFSHTCFDITSWNFAHDFVLMYYRSSLSVVTLRQFLYARRDVLWYGDVRPSVRFSVRPFSALFSYMLWHIELKFCTWLCSNVLQIKFECCQFASSFVGVMPLLELRILEIHSFPHFSLTCFDILSWNFAYDFVLLYYRSSSSVVNFLWEFCPFWNLNYWKCTVFRTFLLHALTYWAEILHMTLFYCTTDKVRVSSICVNYCGSYALFGT